METPPSHTRHHYVPSRQPPQLDLQFARDDLLSKLDLFSHTKLTQKDSQKKAIQDLRKQTRYLNDTKWMFQQENSWQGSLPL